ncbi:MAG: glycosyltransferase [Cyanobacteria bacterium P01_C01_bin.89]
MGDRHPLPPSSPLVLPPEFPSFPLHRTLVLIPVLNEADTIGNVVGELQNRGLSRIRVVDNGSSDGSVDIARDAGAEVLQEPVPGYGRACWRGLQDIPADIEWILFCDGDGSDVLDPLEQFWEAAASGADFVLGNRRATGEGRIHMTPVQNFGNGLATTLIHWGWGERYRDLGPLRLIRRSALEEIQMRDRGFGWTVEMQIRAAELGLKIVEIPVGYRQRQGGRSKISGTIRGSFQAGTIILSTVGNLYVRRIRREGISPVLLSATLLILGAILVQPYGDFRFVDHQSSMMVWSTVMLLGFAASWTIKHIRGRWFWGVAIALRLILLFMYPGNDIWRYLWEGYIQNLGFNPFALPPNSPELIPYRTDWWILMNHLHVSAIYPPLTQWGFRLLSAITPSVLLFKSTFIAADLAVCWLLSRKFGYLNTLAYAWNPVILYSFAGGGHYDSWLVLAMVGAWLAWDRGHHYWSALLIGIGGAIKWISFPILFFIAFHKLTNKRQIRKTKELLKSPEEHTQFKQLSGIENKRKGEIASLKNLDFKSALIILGLGVLPFLLTGLSFCSAESCTFLPLGSSFISNGRSAQLIPYWVSVIFPSTTAEGTNKYYAIPLAIAILFLLKKCRKFATFAESYLFTLLIFSPIIHIWYFSWIVPFSTFNRNLGIRLMSVSSFMYFLLQLNTLTDKNWTYSPIERMLMWAPFVAGFFWTKLTETPSPKANSITP